MKIHIRLYMSLRSRNNNSQFILEFKKENVTVGDLLKKLSLTSKEVGLISVNKQIIRNKKTKLKNDDQVKLFPIVGGG